MKKLTPRIDWSTSLILTAALVLLLAALSPLSAQQGQHGHHGKQVSSEAQSGCAGCQGMAMKDGEGMKCGGMKGEGQGCGGMKGMDQKGGGKMKGMAGHRELMGNIHGLIGNHTKITRQVEKIENGVVTVTRTTDPALVETLQTHVVQMYELIENDGSIRHWDPLFVEIFKHSDKIVMETEMLEDGVRVRETSSDPYVAKLIQAHADKVNEFVARGMDAMHEPTAVPKH